MALKDHTIDSSRISEEQIETIITGYVKYDPARKSVVLLPDAQRFSNEKKILLYLTALRGWSFILSKDTPLGEASPQEISQKTNIPGGSVRPILGGLVDRKVLVKEKGKYMLPSHNLGVVQDILTSSNERGVISESSNHGKRKNKKKQSSKKNSTNNKKSKSKPSLADGFSTLLDEGWFKGGKTLAELKDKLDEMTIFPPQVQLPHYLLKSYREKKLDRKKEKRDGRSVWVYYQK